MMIIAIDRTLLCHSVDRVNENICQTKLLDVDVALRVQRRRQKNLASPAGILKRETGKGRVVAGTLEEIALICVLEEGMGRFVHVTV